MALLPSDMAAATKNKIWIFKKLKHGRACQPQQSKVHVHAICILSEHPADACWIQMSLLRTKVKAIKSWSPSLQVDLLLRLHGTGNGPP